jgi:hypothetical protein
MRRLTIVPPIEKALLKRLQTPDGWLLDISKNIEGFNKLLSTVPPNYNWEFMTAEAFQQISRSLKTESALYRHYWHDMLGQIEAFSIMSAWRLAEIARSAVWATRRDDVVCAAVMSRAALETTAAYAWFQSEVRPALEKVAESNSPTLVKYQEQDNMKDLENKLLRVVFASNLEDAEKYCNPRRIGKIIGDIAKKFPHQEVISSTYFALCEVAHPNMLGRSVYISSVKPMGIPGHEKRKISMEHGPATISILRHAISALSWSTGTFSRSCVVLQDSIRNMLDHLKRISD